MLSWVDYLEFGTTFYLFDFLPTIAILYSIFLLVSKSPEFKLKIKTLYFYGTGFIIFLSIAFYLLSVLAFHVYSFSFLGIPVPKDYLYTAYVITSGIWFFAAGIWYSKIDFKALLRGEVKKVDMRRLLIGMLISLLWIPLIIVIISVG